MVEMMAKLSKQSSRNNGLKSDWRNFPSIGENLDWKVGHAEENEIFLAETMLRYPDIEPLPLGQFFV